MLSSVIVMILRLLTISYLVAALNDRFVVSGRSQLFSDVRQYHDGSAAPEHPNILHSEPLDMLSLPLHSRSRRMICDPVPSLANMRVPLNPAPGCLETRSLGRENADRCKIRGGEYYLCKIRGRFVCNVSTQ